MQINITGRHKSIQDLGVIDLPKFTVISGINGAGKTHFLEVLMGGTQAQVEISPQELFQGKIFLDKLQRISGFGSSRFDSMGETTETYALNIFEYCERRDAGAAASTINTSWEPIRLELRKKLGDGIGEISLDNVRTHLEMRQFLIPQLGNEAASISQIFYEYKFRYATKSDDQIRSRKEFEKRFGPPPWEMFREVITTLGLPIEFNDPSTLKVRNPYRLTFTHVTTGDSIGPTDLSLGEQGILTLAMWLFRSNSRGVFPRLILLDEPDAHLHPSFVHKLINFLYKTLVQKHDCNVIMTTHSPTTVALAPEDSLYEMLPEPSRICKSSSRAQAISNLTSGFVAVLPNCRAIYTEDEIDKTFIESTYRHFENLELIGNKPQLTFLAAVNESTGGPAGGKSNVIRRVKEFNDTPMKGLVRGIRDHDGDDEKTTNVYPLARNCLENYLTDPLLVHLTLAKIDKAPEIPGIGKTRPEDIQSLLDKPNKDLQKIVDYYFCELEKAPQISASTGRTKIRYTSGKSVNLRKWQFTHPGKEILKAYENLFGPIRINRKLLMSTYREYGLVPEELLSLLDELTK